MLMMKGFWQLLTYYLLSSICNHMQIIFKLEENHGHAEKENAHL